mgnify:CR=1 FL=1
MRGFNLAEGAHIINHLAPQSISGGKTGSWFHCKNAEHITLILAFGAFGTNKPDPITVEIAKDVNGTGATAIGFRYYPSKNGAIERVSPPLVAAAAGITAALLSKINNEFVVIELDSEEINATNDGSVDTDYPYIRVNVVDSGNTTYLGILAILTGLRQAYQGGLQMTT